MEDTSIKDELMEIFGRFENLSLLFRVDDAGEEDYYILYFIYHDDDMYEVMNFSFLGTHDEIVELCNKISDSIEEYERDDMIVPILSLYEFARGFDIAKYERRLDSLIENQWDKRVLPKRIDEDDIGKYLRTFEKRYKCVKLFNSLKKKEDNEVHISDSEEEKREETPIIRITNDEVKREEVVVDSDEYNADDSKNN